MPSSSDETVIEEVVGLPVESLISVDELIRQAVKKLRPVQRRVMELRLRNANYRERLGAEVAAALFEDPGFVEICPGFAIAAGSQDDFTSSVGFSFDPAKLAAILDLVLKYLPLFIKLFTP